MSADTQTVTAYLNVKGADAALGFYATVFGAQETYRLTDPADGRIGHAEMRIGGTRLYISDEYPDFGAMSPDSLGGSAVALQVRVADCDAVTGRAEAAGALILRRPADQSFGERVAQLQDPWGHRWMVAQTVEEVSPAEMQRRWDASVSA